MQRWVTHEPRPMTASLTPIAREATRDTARLTVTLSPQQADQLSQDSSCRVMVFCAAEGFQPLSRESDIAFPHNVELKCNSDEVKANLRGLKNKPGSTRPADITHLIRKKGNYPNTVEMVYALTTKVRSYFYMSFLFLFRVRYLSQELSC